MQTNHDLPDTFPTHIFDHVAATVRLLLPTKIEDVLTFYRGRAICPTHYNTHQPNLSHGCRCTGSVLRHREFGLNLVLFMQIVYRWRCQHVCTNIWRVSGDSLN